MTVLANFTVVGSGRSDSVHAVGIANGYGCNTECIACWSSRDDASTN